MLISRNMKGKMRDSKIDSCVSKLDLRTYSNGDTGSVHKVIKTTCRFQRSFKAVLEIELG